MSHTWVGSDIPRWETPPTQRLTVPLSPLHGFSTDAQVSTQTQECTFFFTLEICAESVSLAYFTQRIPPLCGFG